jgi:hypothetical protein
LGIYPDEEMLDVIVAEPIPLPRLWQPVQFALSVGDPVFPPGDPVEFELEVLG